MYKEVQRTLPWWIYLVVALLGVLTLVSSYFLFRESSTIDELQLSVLGSVVIVFLPIAAILLILSIRLETIIYSDGVQYRFFPFQFRSGFIPWTEITRAEVRKYRPFAEFGGWGIRFNLKYKTTAYNISGNMGLELELKNGRKILIGTQRPDEVKTAVGTFYRNP
jgi:hypothetical protein